ncbi:uncharacterized protein LOC131996917 [Stomoxys calcitrans]|uniref:uncharacterized protein LOC131996917 n=1 Tax=Stomoxys calcitrans TaxID=35570 RepID=UPI0027E387D5|nr:uncharacterized protein LOC131996917 [Stomoxys calcitrans]
MTPQQRLKEIKRFNLCLNCFSKVHSVRNCTSKFSCFQCSKRHNTLLHREQVPQSKPSPNSNSSISCTPSPSHSTPSSIAIQSTSSEGEIVQSCFAAQSKGVLLGTALVKIRHNGLAYLARALVDSGSEGTFISEKLFNTLRLPFKRTAACIYGLNNSTSASVQKECSFLLASHSDDDFEVSVSALVVPHLSGSLPSRTIGPIPCERNTSCSRVVSYFCELSLDAAISRFWEVEDLPRKTFLSASDRFCEELYSATTTRDKNGRYIVSLPFKEDFLAGSDIGHSRNAALVQFFRNEARLLRTPQFKDEYDKVLTEYESLGHMTKVSDPISPGLSSHYYLPHHAVVKPDSTTTKVRVVFNASSRASNGKSLNDVLHTGPVLQQDLVVLILNWRLFRYVFNGDITKMYRQILVNPEHRAFQRILFRQDPNGKVQDYELSTVTFGVNCAPFLAIRTLLQLADDVRGTYPLAYEILRNSMYVDDALVGAHSIPAAIDARGQLIQALGSAGFAMRWRSNGTVAFRGFFRI